MKELIQYFLFVLMLISLFTVMMWDYEFGLTINLLCMSGLVLMAFGDKLNEIKS